jgi:hypothetical protein
MNCLTKLKALLQKGVKNETTGSLLNYYTMYIRDPSLRKVLNEKFLENF